MGSTGICTPRMSIQYCSTQVWVGSDEEKPAVYIPTSPRNQSMLLHTKPAIT